ncbi:cell surface hyaluronidase-like [Branchiostoma floridae x Branchiostoma belcheri]
MARVPVLLLPAALLLLTPSASSQRTGCPDVDPSLVPWNPGHDPSRREVIGQGQVYRLESSATFDSLEIKDGGKLVFADEGNNIILRTRSILVQDGGEFHIGSETCPYLSDVTISLYGKSDEGETHPLFGKKFFGVNKDGVVEIHGKPKLSWTQLTATVMAEGLPKGGHHSGVGHRGINLRVLDELTGEVVENDWYDTYINMEDSKRLSAALNGVDEGRIIIMAVRDEGSKSLGTAARKAIRSLGSKEIDKLSYREPWVFLGVKGNASAAMEKRLSYKDTHRTGTAQVSRMFTTPYGVSFKVEATSSWSRGKSDFHIAVTGKVADYVINLNDDVTSWQPGDRIVFASTDYSMEQTEEFDLLPCPECSSYQVRINGKPKYMHFGEISDGVDLRGEVGLLSRNVRIQGEVDSRCYGDNFCQFFDYDTFGGHFKVLGGFKSVHLSGAEITHMGQQILGRYPVHFHLAGDVDERGGYVTPTYVRDLSIHHCFSRCVTIHATNGLLVQDTVGYDTLGHCFYLEDGVEERNRLVHNLGLVTRPGTLLPTDRDQVMCRDIRSGVYGDYIPLGSDCNAVSTFWISHPNNDLVNNSAAGSMDTGIWYIFHEVPTGLSEGLHLDPSTIYTPLGRCYNNKVHSNDRAGFMLDCGVKTTHPNSQDPREYLAMDKGRYAPHEDGDVTRDRVPALIEGLIAYKNHNDGAWVRGGELLLDKCAFVDNGKGLTLSSDGTFPSDDGSKQQVWNSVFIGESENIGTDAGGNKFYGPGGVGKVWRTLPRGRDFPMRGIQVYDGPTRVVNCTFKKYARTEARKSSAIGFLLDNTWQGSPKNNLTRVKFENTASRVYYGNPGPWFGSNEKDGDKTSFFHDLDGTITGYPDVYVTRIDNWLARNPGCVEKPDWKGVICSGKYAQLYVQVRNPHTNTMWVRRDEYPDHPLKLHGALVDAHYQQYQPAVMLEKGYTIHWDGMAPAEITIHPINFDRDDWIRVGLCYPPRTQFQIIYQLWQRSPKKFYGDEEVYPAYSVEDIENSVGNTYFFDESTGLLFLKVSARYHRDGDSYCSSMGCERIIVHAFVMSDEVANCTIEAYPKYQAPPTETVPMATYVAEQESCSACGSQVPIVFDDRQRYANITIVSSGFYEMKRGLQTYIEVNGVKILGRRGYLVVAVDVRSGNVTHQRIFDTFAQARKDEAMAKFIRKEIPLESIILVSVKDESSRRANQCLQALREIGAKQPVKTGFRGSFAMIGYKGLTQPSWIQQINLPPKKGPAEIRTSIPLLK